MTRRLSDTPAGRSLRIGPLPRDQAGPNAARALDGPVGNLTMFQILARAESNILPILKLGATILSGQMLDARSRELMVLAVLAIEDGQYQWAHHSEIAQAVGISIEEIAAIRSKSFEASFAPRDRALLRFASDLVVSPRIADPVFAGIRGYLSEQEIIEAIVAVGFYMMLARVTECVGLGAEAPKGGAVMTSLGMSV